LQRNPLAAPSGGPDPSGDALPRDVLIKRLTQVAASTGVQAAALFASAGRLDWLAGWVLVATQIGHVAFTALYVIPRNPHVIGERAEAKGKVKRWDKWVGALFGLSGLAALIVAGLDYRYAWSKPPHMAVRVIALGLIVPGNLLFSWAMASNRYFSTMVQVQTERGHEVATGGPYRRVRHPGYAGAVLALAGLPLLLGRWWAYVPAAVAAGSLVLRTALEDRALREELPGYSQYAGRVRYRLVPGIW